MKEIPILSIDNLQVIEWCKFDIQVLLMEKQII